jgi:hypothetical protein
MAALILDVFRGSSRLGSMGGREEWTANYGRCWTLQNSWGGLPRTHRRLLQIWPPLGVHHETSNFRRAARGQLALWPLTKSSPCFRGHHSFETSTESLLIFTACDENRRHGGSPPDCWDTAVKISALHGSSVKSHHRLACLSRLCDGHTGGPHASESRLLNTNCRWKRSLCSF